MEQQKDPRFEALESLRNEMLQELAKKKKKKDDFEEVPASEPVPITGSN